ncbi:MAG: apolipoprotein N-acyltransferase [Termitinemataceae bacterium]|nr:MAG: apolipoprotein N-acyltransferase [Termitinemataceae bacterium]
MYTPLLIVVRRVNLGLAVLYGAIYGALSFSLLCYWVSAYHLLAGITVSLIYMVFFASLAALLKLAVILFPKNGYLLQWLLWISFEYLRTKGFLGFSYGITGYTQWQNTLLIQIADIFGIWGLSALVLFPSFLLSNLLSNYKIKGTSKNLCVPLSAFLWFFCLIASFSYGIYKKTDFSSYPQAKIALIQSNSDPNIDTGDDYRADFKTLSRLSDASLSESPADLVVWPETAFIPMIYWHQHYRTSDIFYKQVKELTDYLAQKNTPFLIGNDDGRRLLTDEGEQVRVDYNAAILLEGGAITDVYRKIHLVPFSEHFPYKKQLPFIYALLLKTDTHFWTKGEKYTVFNLNSVKFASPICFEDTFSEISRNFANNGAEFFANLSNDAWAHSQTSQMQHLSMAVFRSVENKRSTVRSTTSGITCAIDPNGKIIASLEPFTESYINVSIPLVETKTFYTKHGDFLPLIAMAVLVIIFIVRVVKTTDRFF